VRKLRITLDEDLCKSSRNCVYRAPNSFKPRDRDSTEIVEPPGDSVEAIVDAGLSCPQWAIGVYDADTGEDLLASASKPAEVTWRLPGGKDGEAGKDE
jgi:ferredoxin